MFLCLSSSRSRRLSSSGYVVSCWNLACENFASWLNISLPPKKGILLTSRHQACFISILQSSKVVRVCPTAGKEKLAHSETFRANPFAHSIPAETPSPLPLVSSPMISFIIILNNALSGSSDCSKQPFFSSLRYNHFLHFTGLQFLILGKCT